MWETITERRIIKDEERVVKKVALMIKYVEEARELPTKSALIAATVA